MTTDHSDPCDEFRHPGNSLADWKSHAESLVSAAEILRMHAGNRRKALRGTRWPELMLWGCAIETLLKTLRLKQAIDWLDSQSLLYRNDAPKGDFPKDHNLVKLAQWVCFPLDPDRREVLQELTKAVRYAGRYPVPTSGKLESHFWFGPQGDDEVDSIIRDLLDRLPDDPGSYQKEKLKEAKAKPEDAK